MSHSKGARLYLRAASLCPRTGAVITPAQWVIRDGKISRRTGCLSKDADGAERALAAYIASKYTIDRSAERCAADVPLTDVLSIYAQDVVAHHARPNETLARLEAINRFWKADTLAAVTGATCRAYAASRPSIAAARRELEDLRSAINHHRKEGLCREIVCVVLPEKSAPRERWLTRDEAARAIRAAYRYREVQKGHATGRHSRRHVARFILLGVYTGTRAGALCSAAFDVGPGQGFLDLDRGVFHRKRQGARETKKRQPPVRLPDRLLAHLRRWRRLGISRSFAVEFNGEPIGKINKAFRAVMKDAGLDGAVVPHSLRHTAATWAMQSGMSLSDAADLLGMTEETLRRVYYHHHPDFQVEGAKALGRGGRRE